MGSFLQEIFSGLGRAFGTADGGNPGRRLSCSGSKMAAVDYVVEETYRRLRFMSGYARSLEKPVATALDYIDQLVQQIPEPVQCSRAAYAADRRVNAFFASPDHLQEVFSRNAQVHDLFDAEPNADECWALLCMRKEERHHLGVSLVGDAVRKDVMQTVVNFADHQVLSPAATEEGARTALKCCIFNGVLAHIRKRASDDRIRVIELESRRESLLAQRNRNAYKGVDPSDGALQRQIDEVGRALAREVPRQASLEYHLDLLVDVLGHPSEFVSGSLAPIHLSRLGIKLDDGASGDENEILLFEIRVASHGTRVGTLVHFPRSELLGRQHFLQKADLFLSV